MVQPHLPDGANAPSHDGTLTPPGEYDLNCAHWRHLPNTTELVLPSAQPSPQPKRQTDPFQFLHTSRQKVPTFQWAPFSPKIAPSHGGSETNPNGNHHRFSYFCTDNLKVSLYFTMGHPFPSKLSVPMGDLDPHLIHGSPAPPESSTQTAS